MRRPWPTGGYLRRKKEKKKRKKEKRKKEREGGVRGEREGEGGKTELSSILSTENDITTSLSYEQTIEEYAAKKCKKELVIEVCQAVNKNTMLFFWILRCVRYLSAFLNL